MAGSEIESRGVLPPIQVVFLKSRELRQESRTMFRSSYPTAPDHAAESGMTLVEVMLAITVLAVGAFSALSTLTSAMALDEELKERGVAMRAAMTKIESIVAYDYNNNINNLVTYWNQGANNAFTVEGLKAQNGAPNHGGVTVDVSDPSRIRFTVTIRWQTRHNQARTLSLPVTLTEVVD
jgi:prepilin-type N-terminal cleavage/methylation domain-containing protein